MNYFAGLDVSLEWTSVCVVDGDGRIVREAKVLSEPDALVAFLAELRMDVTRICLEAGPLSQWLYEGLAEAGLPVVCAEIPRRWKVIQTVREKFTCRDCERISQPPAPFHATPRGWAGPNLLATILFEKYGQHLPLNRQRDRYAREGVDLSLSTLADQVGACAVALKPLHDLIAAHVLAAERLHGDDTPVPVLAKGKTDTARAWVYVRDDASFGGPDPPAALFRYARDRSGDHPVEHLRTFAGILQADAYAGYRRLYAHGRSPGPVTEALCWSHGRRKFYELADIAANKRRGKRAPPISPLALEAVKRIDALFDIEREINGEPAGHRHAVRRERSAPGSRVTPPWPKPWIIC